MRCSGGNTFMKLCLLHSNDKIFISNKEEKESEEDRRVIEKECI